MLINSGTDPHITGAREEELLEEIAAFQVEAKHKKEIMGRIRVIYEMLGDLLDNYEMEETK